MISIVVFCIVTTQSGRLLPAFKEKQTDCVFCTLWSWWLHYIRIWFFN